MSFYITTPLYYVNDTPHIGHAYTTVVCDVLNRYHKLFGEETFFLTGTDEHGQKVENAAAQRGKSAQDHVDEYVQQFQDIWKELQIEEDFFIRTTMEFHKAAVQKCLQDLWDRGEIYEKDYEGLYCESEEMFYTDKELVDGKTPLGNDVQLVKEKNYFFKMSRYQDQLIRHIEDNPSFIQPDVRRNEILGFLKKPLGDLSISRPKSRLKWGIEIPFDTDHVTYVWFDALLNYATAVGLHQEEKKEQFERLWPNAIHVIGKDILMTHSVYWTTMLMALQLPLPKQIFAHGWWLTDENEKMSKSKNNVFPLIAEEKKVKKLCNKMVTDPQRVRREDPGDPDVCPVYYFHKLFSSEEDKQWVREGCTTAGIGCGDCKARLASNINKLMEKPREKKKELLNNPGRLDSIIADGCQRARDEAEQTLKQVRDVMKFHSGMGQ